MEPVKDMQRLNLDQQLDAQYLQPTDIVEGRTTSPEDFKWTETNSVYTDGPDIHISKKEAYISSFGEDLFNQALTNQPNEESLQRIFAVLPELLKIFALKVGNSGPTQIHRDVMVFIRRHRRLV
jgi:hypothetical protein